MEWTSAVWIIGGAMIGAAALFILTLGAFVSARDKAFLRNQSHTLSAWAAKRDWRYQRRDDHRLSIIDLSEVVAPPETDDTSIAGLCSRPDNAEAEHVIYGHRHGHSVIMFQRRFSPTRTDAISVSWRRVVRSSYTAITSPGPTPVLVLVYQAAELVDCDNWQLRTVTTSDGWFDRNFTILTDSHVFARKVLNDSMRFWLKDADLTTDTCIVVANGWCFIPRAELLRPSQADKDLELIDTFVRRIPYHVWRLEDGV